MTKPDPHSWLDEHGSALYAFAMLHLRDGDRAEDLVQDTLLAALQSWQRFKGDCALRTWLIGILKHKILDEYRRLEREGTCVDSSDVPANGDCRWGEGGDDDGDDFMADGHWREASSDWGNPEHKLAGERFWRLIFACIDALPERAARLFVLRELWEMDTDTVCKELHISPSNLWTSLHRVRLKMRACLQRSHIGMGSDLQ